MKRRNILSFVLLLPVLLVACGKKEDPNKLFTVNFYLSKNIIDTQTVTKGSKVTEPATPEGYIINDWYSYESYKKVTWDFDSSLITDDTNIYANYTLKEYSITYNLDGGVLPTTKHDYYTVEDEVYIYNPGKTGYTFLGWTGSNGDTPQTYYTQPKGSTGDKVYNANWSLNSYTITLDPNGGTLDTTTLSVDYGGVIPTLPTPTKSNSRFNYWALSTTPNFKFEETTYTFTNNITLVANYTSKQTLNVTSNDETLGTVSITSGDGYTGDTMIVQASPIGENFFRGWYSDGTLVSTDNPYTFTMPNNAYSLTAKFESREKALGIIPAIDTTTNTVTYGLYPQTHVNDTALTAELDKLTTTESNSWYLYKGEYYAKRQADPWANDYTFDDGITTIKSGTTYWFKCEPITWKILKQNNNEYTLLSNVLLDTCCYYNLTSTRTIDGNTIYANNYEYSTVRAWLNKDFYNSAFALNNVLIQTTEVDNSASTTNTSTNSYVCENTSDKVYLLSYQDYFNTSYGFTDNATRQCKTTDFARAKMASISVDVNSKQTNYGYSWTRSPHYSFNSYALLIDQKGNWNSASVARLYSCVRPAITITIS